MINERGTNGWSCTGWIAGGIWNLLIVVLMVLVLQEFRFGRDSEAPEKMHPARSFEPWKP
ncbi:MAG: hypothetical protein NTZ35_08220 [Ignavibacteriales bacterium]|nr:hypothetical protein [Ignavibacteriales bacterium]